MSDTFRLRPPPGPQELVPRPRLTQVVRSTAPGGACVVTAPAGYGTTTLLMDAVTDTATVFWAAVDGLPDTEACALLAEALGVGDGVDAALERLAQSGSCWLVVDGVRTDT